jgi:hypothetical protein
MKTKESSRKYIYFLNILFFLVFLSIPAFLSAEAGIAGDKQGNAISAARCYN